MDIALGIHLIVAYLVGNISSGWLIARKMGAGDLRALGSGATGATNAARVLGRRFFYIVLGLDMLKGVFVVLMPFFFHGGDIPLAYYAACILCVVSGHIWPMLLGFRGGKGVAPFLGGWLAIGAVSCVLPLTLVAALLLGACFLPLKKGILLTALMGLPAQPLAVWLLTGNAPTTAVAAATVAIILFAHRGNLKRAFSSQ